MKTMGTLRLHTVRCSNRAELSSWSLEEVSHRRAPRYAASLVLLGFAISPKKLTRRVNHWGLVRASCCLLVPKLQARLSLLLGCVGFATVSTMLEPNKLARRALVLGSYTIQFMCCWLV